MRAERPNQEELIIPQSGEELVEAGPVTGDVEQGTYQRWRGRLCQLFTRTVEQICILHFGGTDTFTGAALRAVV